MPGIYERERIQGLCFHFWCLTYCKRESYLVSFFHLLLLLFLSPLLLSPPLGRQASLRDMSTCGIIDVAPAAEQLCYIPCNFCNIVLAVSVPCSSLFDIVTVRCGHCTNLWSVNMAAAFQSLSWQNLQAPGHCNPEYRIDTGSTSKCNNRLAMRAPSTHHVTEERIVNRPPEKRQRVPSAYNQFIKEEIQRIKANNPDISHREAFSTAAKNWAHFPHIHFGLMLENNNQAKMDNVSEKHLMSRAALLNK